MNTETENTKEEVKKVVVAGKVYYNMSDFAKMMGISFRTVSRYVSQGVIFISDPRHRGEKLIDWETESFKTVNKLRGNAKTTPRVKRNKYVIDNIPTDPKVSSVQSAGLPSVEDVDADVKDVNLVIDTENFDRDKHKDCWVMKDPFNPVRDAEGLPMMDWNKLKEKVSALTIQFKLDREKGKYVDKSEQVRAINGIASILRVQCESVPNRYTSVLLALAESFTGHEFTSVEKSQIRNAMSKVPAEFWGSIAVELGKLAENDDENDQDEVNEADEIVKAFAFLSDKNKELTLERLSKMTKVE